MSNCCQNKNKKTSPGGKLTFKDMVKNAFSFNTKPVKTKAKNCSCRQNHDQTKSAKACC